MRTSRSTLKAAAMGPAAYVIAILGCADGAADCTPVAMLPTRYESEATCYAATGGALADSIRIDFRSVRGTPRVTDGGRGG
jgi:hypothetical protein